MESGRGGACAYDWIEISLGSECIVQTRFFPSFRRSKSVTRKNSDALVLVWKDEVCTVLAVAACISRPFQWARPDLLWLAMGACSYCDGLVYVWRRHAGYVSSPFWPFLA
jgi:hypothetical protein